MSAHISSIVAPRAPAPALRGRYREVRQASLNLCAGLSPEDCALQSMPDASPVKWHLGHTSWFFETFVLENNMADYRKFNPDFRVLFNSYYMTVGERHPRPERGMLSRPSFVEILDYRQHVDAGMQRLLQQPSTLPDALADLIELGLHHEQQHQELILTDLKHLFSCNPAKPAYRDRNASKKQSGKPAVTQRWHAYPDGLHHIGHDGNEFCFDNEQPRHRVFVEQYELAHRLVTNGEYLAFMADGGYTRPELWLSEGWDVVRTQNWQAPLYWELREGGWRAFTLSGMKKIELATPVCHVSYYEADAYARWANARLPTEAEWEIAAQQVRVEGNFVDDSTLHPGLTPVSDADTVPSQMFGDVWQWTQSSYAPYPGYHTPPGAVGEYNGKFMVNQYVLRGGSCATPRSHIRATYRNFFPAAARWQFSGIRLARHF